MNVIPYASLFFFVTMLQLLMLSNGVADELVSAGIATGDKVSQADSYFTTLERAAKDAINELKQTSSIQALLPGSKLKTLKIKSVFETITPDNCFHELSLARIQNKILEHGCTHIGNNHLYSIVISNFTSATDVNNVVFPYSFEFILTQPDTDLDALTLQYDDSGTGQKQWETTKTLLKLAFLNWYFSQIEVTDVADSKIAYKLFGGLNDKLDTACIQVPSMKEHCDLLKNEVANKLVTLRSRLENN